jgi:FAD/FMN-containing dehydrogenase
VAGCLRADRVLSFDEATGRIRAESGLTLLDLNRIFLPRKFFSPVTPGTQYVTLGGMVAADVHGKNHHVGGTFGRHVEALRILLADGRVVDTSPQENEDLFFATQGGMGLTGHILEVQFRLDRIPSPWIRYESQRLSNLDALAQELQAAAERWPYTVAWIDGLAPGKKKGRGILSCGRWANGSEAPASMPRARRPRMVPAWTPGWVLSTPAVQLFNVAYYWRHLARRKAGIVDPETFFYPLDAALEWNRAYGPRGFIQYQCALPREAGVEAVRSFLQEVSRAGGTPYLGVLKDFGEEAKGLLSFPMPGFTLALDFPRGKGTQRLVDHLNGVVAGHGGRIYLAKDAFSRVQDFRRLEPRVAEWMKVRRKWDPEGRLKTAQSKRLLGDQA